MKDKIKLSIEEQAILHKLDIDQLRFLISLDDSKDKQRLVEILMLLIGREKEVFFQENGLRLNPERLYALHAYSRGSVAAFTMFFHLIRGAKIELDKRSKKEDR